MNEAVNESLRKICNYQQNVPQHYYLSDTLVNIVIVVVIFNVSTFRPWGLFLESPGSFRARKAIFGDQFLFLWNRARFIKVGLELKTASESGSQHQIGHNPLVCSIYYRALLHFYSGSI